MGRLTQLGIECYVPWRHSFIRPRHAKLPKGQRLHVTTPWFPGYLFIRFKEAERWDLIHQDPGVIGVLTMAGAPAPVGEKQLAKVRAFEATERDAAERVVAPTHGFKVGQVVEVLEGPFSTFSARIEKILGDRLELTTFLFGRATPLSARAGQVRAALGDRINLP